MKKTGLFIFMMLLVILGSAAAETRYVTGGNLKIRGSADSNGSVLGTLYAGAPVEVISESGEWSSVRLADVTGWMKSSFLASKPSGDSTRQGTASSPYGTPTVILRSKPSNSYGTVSVLRVGESVRVIGEMQGGFLCVTAQGTGFLDVQEVK